jgi:hypothetical protein
MRGWSLGLLILISMALHINSLAGGREKKKKTNNLEPYNEPRIAQTFHYWSQEFLASTPSLKWALVMGVF